MGKQGKGGAVIRHPPFSSAALKAQDLHIHGSNMHSFQHDSDKKFHKAYPVSQDLNHST